MKRRTVDITATEEGWSLLRWVGAQTNIDSTAAEKLISQGSVYVQGRRCKDPLTSMRLGQTVSIVLGESGRSTLEPSRAPLLQLTVLWEDEAIIAVDKPAGVTAQPTPAREGESLLESVALILGRAPGLVHRLDRDTTGVTVFGKTTEATAELARQFREGVSRKRYLAVCGSAVPSSGTVDLPLSKDPSRPGRFRASRVAHGVPALTEYRRLAEGDGYSLVVLFPRTGRTHQLRAHLAALNSPILGDARYGGALSVRGETIKRCLLHAQALQILDPLNGKTLLLEAPLPSDMQVFFERCGTAAPSGPW